jgi:hypothetical protein
MVVVKNNGTHTRSMQVRLRVGCEMRVQMVHSRSRGDIPNGNRVLSPSAALCHWFVFNCDIPVNCHTDAIERKGTNVIKGLGSGQNVHVFNCSVFGLEMVA